MKAYITIDNTVDELVPAISDTEREFNEDTFRKYAESLARRMEGAPISRQFIARKGAFVMVDAVNDSFINGEVTYFNSKFFRTCIETSAKMGIDVLLAIEGALMDKDSPNKSIYRDPLDNTNYECETPVY